MRYVNAIYISVICNCNYVVVYKMCDLPWKKTEITAFQKLKKNRGQNHLLIDFLQKWISVYLLISVKVQLKIKFCKSLCSKSVITLTTKLLPHTYIITQTDIFQKQSNRDQSVLKCLNTSKTRNLTFFLKSII